MAFFCLWNELFTSFCTDLADKSFGSCYETKPCINMKERTTTRITQSLAGLQHQNHFYQLNLSKKEFKLDFAEKIKTTDVNDFFCNLALSLQQMKLGNQWILSKISCHTLEICLELIFLKFRIVKDFHNLHCFKAFCSNLAEY